jgi:hypothetical protein
MAPAGYQQDRLKNWYPLLDRTAGLRFKECKSPVIAGTGAVNSGKFRMASGFSHVSDKGENRALTVRGAAGTKLGSNSTPELRGRSSRENLDKSQDDAASVNIVMYSHRRSSGSG